MNKTLLILLLTPTLSLGQLKDFLIGKEPDLESWIKSSDSQQAYELLNSEGHLTGYILLKDSYKYFHFIDFDADGLTDILYNGSGGGESRVVAFFRNMGDQYSKVYEVMGKLVYVNDFKPYEPFSFAVNHYGCCASINDVFEFYSPTNIGNKFTYQLTNKIAHISGMEFPKGEFVSPIAFKTINPEYTLRIQPIIDNGEPYHPDYVMPGNVMAVYPPGSLGTAIATRTDDTGRVWYFAIMKNNIDPIKEILFTGYNNEASYYTMGWISSRYVEKI